MEISWGAGGFCTWWQTMCKNCQGISLGHIFLILYARCHECRVPRLEEGGRRGGHMFLILYARYQRYLAAYVGT